MNHMIAYECSTYQYLSQRYYGEARIYRFAIEEKYKDEDFLKRYNDAMEKGSWWASKARKVLGAGPWDDYGHSLFYKNTLWEGK